MPGMTRTRIKICGIRTADAARAAANAGADAVGLVFAPASPRCVTMSEAEQVIAALPAFVEPVALFVDVSPEQIAATTLNLGIRTVQLHGGESAAFGAALAPLRVIRALHFTPNVDSAVRTWRRTCPNLAALLWDTPPPGANTDSTSADTRDTIPAGGHGVPFDWRALATWNDAQDAGSMPAMVLAGGLTPANVGEAITMLRPFGVDVSSGVESARGVKDARLIAAFCDAVRRADREHSAA